MVIGGGNFAGCLTCMLSFLNKRMLQAWGLLIMCGFHSIMMSLATGALACREVGSSDSICLKWIPIEFAGRD